MTAGIAGIAIDSAVAVARDCRLVAAVDVRVVFPAACGCGAFSMALGQRICHPEGCVISGVVAVVVITCLAGSEAEVDVSGLLGGQFQQAYLLGRCCELVLSSRKGLYRGRLVSCSLNIDICLIVICCTGCQAAQIGTEGCAAECGRCGVAEIS